MSWQTAVTAIKTKFRTEWTLTPLTSVAFANERFDPPDDAEWLYVEVVGGTGRIAGYGRAGANLIRRDGIVSIHAFVPEGSGESRAIQLVETAIGLFSTASFSGIQFWAPNPVSPVMSDLDLGNRSLNGLWWRMYATIPFQYDSQG